MAPLGLFGARFVKEVLVRSKFNHATETPGFGPTWVSHWMPDESSYLIHESHLPFRTGRWWWYKRSVLAEESRDILENDIKGKDVGDAGANVLTKDVSQYFACSGVDYSSPGVAMA